MMIFRILQIKDIEATDYAFRGYDENKFKLEDYEVKYCKETDAFDSKSDQEVLDFLFYIFNMAIPNDFEGHSLSMSNLVALESEGKVRLYYCDLCSWTLLEGVV